VACGVWLIDVQFRGRNYSRFVKNKIKNEKK
jgi:hypothetical protein